jgi:hypothetical protein
MKRFVILLITAFFCLSIPVFAEESVLIDFSTLVPDVVIGDAEEPNEHAATIIDFSEQAGTGFTEDEAQLMKISLAMDNWEVDLASSSKTVFNQTRSMVKSVPVRDDASRYAGERVLGIRIHYPTEPYNSWGMIVPPFEIPVYMKETEVQGDGTVVTVEEDVNRTKFDGYGVVKNVGVLKSLSMSVMGLNYPMGAEVIIQDQNNRQMAIFLGYLDFDGWRTLTWQNPNYITQVNDRELRRFPLYPRMTPSIKFVGLRFTRDASVGGGDFITYVKDISVTYDLATLDLQMDINNEEVWGILGERESSRRSAEFDRLGELQVLRALERKKMDAVNAEVENGGQQ